MGPQTMIACGDAKACHVVVENSEKTGFPTELCKVGTNKANDGGEGEDSDVEIVELCGPVTPSDGWKGFYCFESVLDVVVGNIEVGRNGLVDELRLLPGGGRHGRRGNRRHGGRKPKVRNDVDAVFIQTQTGFFGERCGYPDLDRLPFDSP